MRADRASLENFHIFIFQTCYFLQYYVGTSDTMSQKHIHFQVSNNINYAYIYIHNIINAFSFYPLWYDAIISMTVYRQNTNTEKMYVYASERSERA